MSGLRYTKEHEWVRLDGRLATVGISDYAQTQLGDVVYVELPAPGRLVAQGAQAAVVESVKAASEVYAPVAGKVVAVNQALNADPSVVNADPTGKGWFMTIEVDDPAAVATLMDEAGYAAFVASLA